MSTLLRNNNKNKKNKYRALKVLGRPVLFSLSLLRAPLFFTTHAHWARI